MVTASDHSQTQRYNYEHFMPDTLMEDVERIEKPEHPAPGEPAPDFSLKDTDGKEWHLHNLHNLPVILFTGSGTCPLTQGCLPGLKDLYEEYGERCQWLMLYVREAHPGEHLPAHKSYEQKRDQAEYFRRVEDIPWPILVDDLEGKVHKQYGLLANAVFIIDLDGRVSFAGGIAHAPTLREALEHLFAQNLRGVVPEDEDNTPHWMGPAVYGWKAIERGGEISKRDMGKRMPSLPVNVWRDDKAEPVIGSTASSSGELGTKTKVALIAAAAVAGFLAFTYFRAGAD